ncbi:TVP38/TMEM64 family protein [Paenibacillus sp. GSMTC-2017]|uniref:TVP38/TMEM64 family protein n=1 Tax=Paenibacillus sp. GSMTC-2017 TaxID=2794350 RepID=UPI0018D63B8C|nr:TVP38/TMEM64 family protein [Paenibacillus sp. GSMTC-2017]MBH5318637.1 TVP38/TMEM64 family protein [Paenibacillus sp. GSMTC-2017]
MIKKLALAAVYVAIAYLIYIYGDNILAWFQQANSIPLIIIMASIMALFPIIPYPIVGGVIGAALGPILGAVITWAGSSIASILMFLFVRYGYQEWGQRILARNKSISKITVMFERNAFLTILFARMIPFIPSIVVNVYAALSRVSFTSYTIASSLGKIPSMLLFAVVGDSVMSSPQNMPITIAVYAVFIAIALGAYRLWQKRGIVQHREVKQ